MLYTKKGDGGTTKTFGPGKPRISKNSQTAHALGSLDELNAFLGLVKIRAGSDGYQSIRVGKNLFLKDIVFQIQQSLFIVQAELAGAEKTITEKKVRNMEQLIDVIEASMPPIKTFFISGGTELSVLCDIARTMARRAEREITGAIDLGEVTVGVHTQAYVNRLSSLLYAFTRLVNHESGITEEPPTYV